MLLGQLPDRLSPLAMYIRDAWKGERSMVCQEHKSKNAEVEQAPILTTVFIAAYRLPSMPRTADVLL